ncbi:MAG: Ppx/GppA phosphatase family protein [Acidimicrobiales bacterium]
MTDNRDSAAAPDPVSPTGAPRPAPSDDDDLHAAIDIGTNSIHLVVARQADGGGFEVVTTEKESVRLGSGGGDMKRLTPEAVERGVAALTRMVETARSLGADVTAVATSAVREAENRAALVDRVEEELGLRIDVISGYEEARLIHRGVIHALSLAGERMLVVDIGGGSTEFVIAEGSDVIEARSLRLGAIRLTQRFFKNDPQRKPSRSEVQRCRRYLGAELSVVAGQLGGHRPEVAVGSSGTIEAVAAMVAAGRGEEVRQFNGYRFSARELGSVVDAVTARPPAERDEIPGLDARRQDIIIGGVLLLDEIFTAFGLESMVISDYALREGVLFDRFPAGDDHLHDLRRSNALRLARQLDPDPEHAETTARLATQLFDRTTHLHGLGPAERELLDVASIVHNVGLVVAHSGHHKHSAYIIRNTNQLTGFSEEEIELIALTVRYHRKSRPSDKHPDFAALDEPTKRTVRILSGLMRVAIGLDRRRRGLVKAVSVRSVDDGIVIEPVPRLVDADLDVEVFSANERARLLADGLDLRVCVEARPPLPDDA